MYVDELRSLAPLPKPHYSDGLDDQVLFDQPLLGELARICGAVSLQADWHERAHIDAAVVACQEHSAGLVLNYRPYAPGRVGQDRSPADTELLDAELGRLRQHFCAIQRWIKNRAPVQAILLDCEQWRYQEWPNSLSAVYRAIEGDCAAFFPLAKLSWFGSGLRKVGLDDDFKPHGHFPPDYPHRYRCCSLYFPDQPRLCKQTIAATRKAHPEPIIAWLSLGSGWHWKSRACREFQWDHDYDIRLDARLGWSLNSVRRPWDRVAAVAFWPPAFDRRVPSWGERFVAYVQGAARRCP